MKEEVLFLLQEEIENKHLPGVAIKVSHKNTTILEEALGWRIDSNDEKEKMQLDTVFDLASLTKVVATLPAVLKLIDNGLISLGDSVNKFLPKFASNNKKQVTVLNLLTHTSGLVSHMNFYKNNLSREEIFNLIYREELKYSVSSKVIYSDLGFMLLSNLVEEVTTQNFNDFVQREIFDPLEMKETGFSPNFSNDRYAATEYDDRINSYKLGVVHDENTEALGGVSGHAGLFSTLEDLSHFTSMIENNGIYKNKEILSSASIKLSRENFTKNKSEFRGLGWQLKTGSNTSCGDYFSEKSYGHTGFTGTSIWFDPTIDLNVILLTNRVHYGRKMDIQHIRPRLHNVIRKYI